MIYSPEEKRKIILNNYSYPSKQIEIEELRKISDNLQIRFSTFRSLDQGCGDVIHLLIIQKDDNIEKCFFSAQQSCLITVAFANILCSYLEGKDLKLVWKLINNCQMMVGKKEYNLNDCLELEAFSDISNFPNRVECINLVIRGMNACLNNC